MPECEFLEVNCKVYLKDGLTCCFPTLNRFCLPGIKSNADPTLFKPTKTHFTRNKNLLCPLPLTRARVRKYTCTPATTSFNLSILTFRGEQMGTAAGSVQPQAAMEMRCIEQERSGDVTSWPWPPKRHVETVRCCPPQLAAELCPTQPIRAIPSVHTVHLLVPQTLTWGRLEQQSSSAWF